ncbi:ABC transporter ATP-binding protein [Desulforhopalus singaporensis]|uniref:Spermidine/putrescine transport system ATP-binding protein n=1 Tax=Desulforhopalus singaporensis TaxID=91360 RepID=A0A1H0J5K3_9BACT|nr:ABC transporter ATP-binding protein [Desulforhopalus singaporensis]SDO39015.1 spermidine/putrescine transport system ATP-binding protein [Desulforhopalus singaporensis]
MSTPAKTILKVSDLSRKYREDTILDSVSFSLLYGEILCLLGPSGSGKTSLLRLLAGLDNVETGSVLFENRDIRSTPAHKRQFGMMFQEYALFPHKNVEENIAFGLEMKKMESAAIDKQVTKMLKLVGLEGFGHRNMDELSGGERQRVALARSLAPQPRLLLLDEPLGSLDRTLRDRLTAEIRKILKLLGVTAIFVTHDQHEAFSIADKIGVLHNGRLEQFDRPETVYTTPANIEIARFLGFSNLIRGTVDNSGTFFQSLSGKLRFPVNRAKSSFRPETTLLIRPEGAVFRGVTPGSRIDPFQLCGIVTEKSYLGGGYRVTLLSEDNEFTFTLPLYPQPPEPGETINLTLAPSALVCIDDPAGG